VTLVWPGLLAAAQTTEVAKIIVEHGPKFTNAHGRALYLCTGQQGGGINPR
jgi:hypothetical protein